MENVNDSEPNKDQRSRANIKKCGDEIGKLICKIMGDDSYLNTKQWAEKMKIVKKANNRLDDQQFIQQRLSKLMESVPENVNFNLCVKNALQEPERDPVLNKDYIYKSLPSSSYDILKGKPLQEIKEELAVIKEDLMQQNIIADQKQQLMTQGKVLNMVHQMLSKVMDSLSAVMPNIIDAKAVNPVGGHVQIQNEQQILQFPATPDSIQMNQNGTNDEIQNPEDSRGVASLFPELPVDFSCFNNWDFASVEDLPEVKLGSGEGTSNARANEANMKLPAEETSMVHGFNVYERNASSLNEIFQKHPNFANQFGFKYPDFQTVFMNSLSEAYHKIESKSEILKQNDITSMDEMFEDMELTGLQLSWLTEKLTEVREKEKKRLLEGIDSYKQQLAKLEKKPRRA